MRHVEYCISFEIPICILHRHGWRYFPRFEDVTLNVSELSGNVLCLHFKIQGTREMKVKIKQWNGVASWLWMANDENCGICRMSFNGCCPDCKVPGDDCPLVWGQCSHCFHMHCILKWLNSQQVQQQCPMCRQEWKFKE
uniref:Anaphase-promoting complex subunit 11 n=2 Tax=Oncorhynchus TaxID=8016 RepID=A0A8C7CV86_ONCKI